MIAEAKPERIAPALYAVAFTLPKTGELVVPHRYVSKSIAQSCVALYQRRGFQARAIEEATTTYPVGLLSENDGSTIAQVSTSRAQL